MDLKRTLLLFTAFLIDKGVLSIKPLSCFVGLGNRSARDKQPIIACPEEKRYVCVKMYGGGMGDQIKRYCEKLEPEEYEELLDNEARVAEELIDYDPNCIKTKDRGREVFKCRCSTNKCNSATVFILKTDRPLHCYLPWLQFNYISISQQNLWLKYKFLK